MAGWEKGRNGDFYEELQFSPQNPTYQKDNGKEGGVRETGKADRRRMLEIEHLKQPIPN
jgi:hypothetical protein